MEMTELTVGVNTLLSLIFGLGGALGVWFKLKGKVDIMQTKIDNLEDDKDITHQRITDLKSDVKENRDRSDDGIKEITKEIHSMRVEILDKIGELKR